jgi:hypothetical protein
MKFSFIGAGADLCSTKYPAVSVSENFSGYTTEYIAWISMRTASGRGSTAFSIRG